MIPSHIDVRAPGLRATREARGLTRAELVLLASTTPETLAAVEEGVQVASDMDLRVRLLRALDAEFESIFEVVGVDTFGRISSLPTP